jgi:hypothetical protein
MGDKPFLSDITTLRQRARQHIMNGAVTPGYKAETATVVRLLNEALATEIVCVLRYKRHYFMASGIHATGVAAEFLQHANEEQAHADQIAQRIVQLGRRAQLLPRRPADALARRVRRGRLARRHDQGRSGGRTYRDRQLRRDDPFPGPRRSDHDADAGRHPRHGRRARRGSRELAGGLGAAKRMGKGNDGRAAKRSAPGPVPRAGGNRKRKGR